LDKTGEDPELAAEVRAVGARMTALAAAVGAAVAVGAGAGMDEYVATLAFCSDIPNVVQYFLRFIFFVQLLQHLQYVIIFFFLIQL
jgi:hypothetical protein